MTTSVPAMRRLISLLMVLGLVLAACSPGESGDDATTTTTNDETTTTSDHADEPTSTGGADTTTTEAQSSQGASCVEGSWMLGPETFVEVMQSQIDASEFGDTEITPSDGTYLVNMGSDGTFTGERDEWGFSVVTGDGTFHIRMSGTETGSWSADDTTITVKVDSSNVTVVAQGEVDGQTITLPQSPIQVPDAIAESSTYTCDDDNLAVTTDGFTISLDRA